MKKQKITSLKDTLAYQVGQLYVAEDVLRHELTDCVGDIASGELSREVTEYASLCQDKVLKLERVFNYLMKEPGKEKNEVIGAMVAEAHRLRELALNGSVRDVVFTACLRGIIGYKLARYSIARIFALELELETVAGLIGEIMAWEEEADRKLGDLAAGQLNLKAV